MTTNKIKNIIYAVIWIALFTAFAIGIYTGKLYQPDSNGKVHVLAVFLQIIVAYITNLGAALIVFGIGVFIGVKVAMSKD